MTTAINDSSPRIGRKAVLPAWSADGGVMYGRDAERRAVGDVLRRTRRGAGGVVLVEGEQGIGRSRLLGESVSEAAGQGFSLAAGAADRLGRTIPFFALRTALQPLGRFVAGDHPDGPLDTPAWWISRLRADLERRAAVAPVLVSLDDLQWASPAMLAALRSLPGELKGHPIAWIFARSSARHEDAELLFSVLERDGATRITLGPLGSDAVAGLLTDAFGAPPGPDLLALGSGAAGNPLLLTELIGGLRDDGAVRVTGDHAMLVSPDPPQRIVAAVHQRLESLSGRARHLLAIAAVLGSSFRLEDAADMLAQAPAALLPVVQEAMGAGIVTAAEDAFAFRHALVRRAVAEMIPQPARKALHRQYAQILLGRGGPAALAARHLLQAAHSRDPASLAGLDQAAAQTLPSSPQTAADLAARALELTPPGDPGALPRLVAAAEALAAAGRVGQAARIARDALARPLPAVQEARLRCVLAWVLCTSGLAQDASAEAGLVLARPQLPGDLRDEATIAQLQALAGMPAEPQADRLAGAVLAARDHGDPVIAAARITRAVISWDKGRISQALEFLGDAARGGTEVSADARHAQPLLALAAALVDLRRIDQADGILRAAGRDKLHGIASEAVPPILRARIHLAAGRLADAAAEAEAALATAQTLAAHGYAGVARSVLGMIALRRGDLAAAERHIASRPASMPQFAGIYARAETTLAQAQITEARRGPAAALSLVRDICAGLPAHRGLLAAEPAAAAWLIRVSRAAGDEELAATVARAAEALAGDNPGFGTLATAAAHALGLAHRDPARLAQAAARHEDPWARASAVEDLGVLLAGQADNDQAVRRLTEALDGYAQAGATTDMARIRGRLRELGVSRRHRASSAARPVSGWASLTDTECAASQLVAQGLNNQQIANRMYISIHTVACHLRHVFRKLNIGSRVELALIVIEQGPADNLVRPVSTGPLGQDLAELAARGDAELGEDLSEVVLDGASGDEQPHGNLGVGPSVAGQPGDLDLLGGQLFVRGGGGIHIGDATMAYGHAEHNLALLRQLESETGGCSRTWSNRIPSSQPGCGRTPAEEKILEAGIAGRPAIRSCPPRPGAARRSYRRLLTGTGCPSQLAFVLPKRKDRFRACGQAWRCGMADGADPPVRFAVVHESARSRVTRLSRADRTLIVKEPLGSDAGSRLRHETAILDRLRGVAGVAQLADEPPREGSIVLADAGDRTLTELPKPLPARDLAGIALRLALALAESHRREVIHRDLAPANVVVAADGTPTIVDFALATSIAEIRPEFTHHSEIPGTLAYLAPEQTGRTGRAVDQRADLYALGAVLYELGTGEPPFGVGDPLRLIHDHLARLPAPPADVNQDIPEPLSKIILHLLEKEPDNRYQSADGVVHDLERLRDARPGRGEFRVGERDFPVRLLPPSRLVGRDEQVTALKDAFADALAGRCAGVLVSGVPGVGKTALVDELRPVVTASGGWFVAGKFDEYRRDQEFNAVQQAFTSFGRLLLAEPEDEVAPIRVRMLRALGANAGLLATVVPEFATLLGPGDLGDPLTAGVRAQLVAVGALRAVASKRRPLVIFIDDLQWGGGVPLGFVDMVLSNEGSEGLLLVGAYREGHVDPSHPLAAMLSRWREAAVPHIPLSDLARPDLVVMVSEMLHVTPAAAWELGEVLEPHCHGNPYETVELLNALRRDGVLTAASDGWRWETAAVRAHLTRAEAGGFPASRVAVMPEQSRRAVEAMACLGGRAKLSVLEIAIAAPGRVPDILEPALRDGILVMESGAEDAVRFRHDRIREGVLSGLRPDRRAELHLAMARRLATVPDLFAVAAEQYLPVAGAVTDPGERRVVAGLLRRAADEVTQIGEFPLVHALLTAALALADQADTDALIELHTVHHAALFSLGRLEEADEDYRVLEELAGTVLDRPAATALQVKGLTNRNRFTEAIDLVIRSLRECGIDVPDAEHMPAAIDRQFARLYQWLDHTDPADDMARPDLTDPALLAAGSLLNAMLSPVYFVGDQAMFSWVGLEALRIWTEHGPGHTLVGSAANAAFHAITRRGDYMAAYRAARRILALGEARAYEPDTSHARLVVSLLDSWFEPAENSIQESLRAREGLLAGGDLANAGYTYHQTVVGLLDCGPTLDTCMAQVNAAQAFARRTGTGQTSQWLESYQWLSDVLRREGSAAAAEVIPADRYAGNPLVVIHVHLCRAIAAAIFGDPAEVARNGAVAVRLLPVVTGFSMSALAHPLYGLGLAGQARSADGDERAALLTELDDVLRWLGARAADAPDNFLHLLRLVEAEQAWTMGDFRAAAFAFDSARREVGRRQRPWHGALIAERTGHFYLAHGLEHTGYELLARAREQYLAWGAAAKAEQMEWAYPGLSPSADATVGEAGPAADHPRRATVTAGALDLLGILSASRALSSETSVERLHARVVEVLSAMTGATGVHLVLWDEARHDWVLPAPAGAPVSVLRYLRRTQEPLAVGDATSDDRFARDPYFDGITCCSLLAVPVFGRGALRAVLLLENRLIRGAFTTGRLEAVGLIAGQLAVSLDNAQLYAGYRRIADEQAALRRVATLVARAEPPEAVFAAVAAEAGQLLAVDFAVLVRYDEPDMMEVAGLWTTAEGTPPTPVGNRLPLGGQNVSTLVHRTRRAARTDRSDGTGVVGQIAAAAAGYQSAVGVPVSVESRLWGTMLVGFMRDEVLPSDTEARLSGFAELVATAIANAEARAEVAASRARIIAAADLVRQRIERDLHDGAQQRLVSLALRLRDAQTEVPPGLGELHAKLGNAVTSANDALGEVQEIARGIHPAVLASGGLRPALRALARRSPVPVRVDVLAEQRMPEHVEVSAYYVVTEALTNAAKHARASAVSIRVEVAGELLRVAVTDDGDGGAVVGAGTGLVGLKDRVEALGGRLRLDSPGGGGTSLTAELPITTVDVGSVRPGAGRG